MPKTPRVSPGEIRKAIRDVLSMQAGEPLAEEPMLKKVNRLVGGGVDLTMMRDAIEWNHSEALVRSEEIEELDLKGWVITHKGINHDRIK